MSNKNNKYNRRKCSRRGKYAVVIRIQLILVAVLVVFVGGMLAIALRDKKADNDFQDLSMQVQDKAPTQASETALPSMAAESVAISPTESFPAETIQSVSTETEPKEKSVLHQYAELYQENGDFFGWLKIPDTKLDYPVMHTPDDPEKYLHANFEGEYSYPGVPFLDAKCSADSDNLLIYGHNMPNGSMFRSLLKYQEKNYWEAHPTIQFDTLYEEQEFEVLAAFYDRVYYKTETVFKFYQFIDAEDEADYDNAIAQFKEKALYETGVDAEYGDQLITLVTCAYHTDNGRFVVVAVRK